MASSCRDFLLQPAVSDHALALLCARDLARLCATTTQYRRVAAGLVRAAMKAHHGMVGGALADLHALESIPSVSSVNLRRVGARTVERGSAFCRTLVGSIAHLVALAQNPPACGDEWSLDVELKKGTYSLEIYGWRNPAHGVLDLYLDGVTVTEAGGFDWCGPRTTEHVCRATGIAVRWTGIHRLVGRTCRSNAEPGRRTRYWMCLSRIKFVFDEGRLLQEGKKAC